MLIVTILFIKNSNFMFISSHLVGEIYYNIYEQSRKLTTYDVA